MKFTAVKVNHKNPIKELRRSWEFTINVRKINTAPIILE